ncbi:type II secretion system F family protein [Mumia zhuanghuii]|uniref:Type II secretion system F family protein n=2 Tax=Mumia TaxID=1546255 RepID=A0ABW1QLV7_9ACTN|nr:MULTISPECIES: type II secretion system F family protein [Mumia]KAA1419965.1 type II secretion system F family protein [Mumia zhuanghuii]
MTLALLAGAAVGAGILILVRMNARPVPGVAATLARVDGAKRRARRRPAADAEKADLIDRWRESVGERIEDEASARGWAFARTRADLAVLDKPFAQHLGTKVLLALAALVWFPMVFTLLGYDPLGIPAVVSVLLAVGAFFLPDLQIHGEAEKRRRDFRHVTGSFLDLVAMNLAGGRGLPEALLAASTVGDHWAMVRIREAITNARLSGRTPWEGIAALGQELGVDELRDLASTLGLAGDEGARIRESLLARADSMRRRELADIEGAAGESSQSMLVAQLLMCVAFLVFLAYPAVSKLG